MFKRCFEMILILNDICPQNIFIGGPWKAWGPGPPKILTAVLGGMAGALDYLSMSQ